MLFEKLILEPTAIKSLLSKPNVGAEIEATLLNDENSTFHELKAQALGKVLCISVEDNGFDDTHNLFIQFVNSVLNNNKGLIRAISYDHAYTVYDLIQSGVITKNTINYKNCWLYDSRAYTNDTYKIKALALLTSEDASKWGDPETAPIMKILKANDTETIKVLLNNWQTRDGVESVQEEPSRKKGTQIPKLSLKLNNKDFVKVIQDIYKKGMSMDTFITALVDKIKA